MNFSDDQIKKGLTMTEHKLDAKTADFIKKAKRAELTEYHVYTRLAAIEKNPENAAILRRIGEEEKSHYEVWNSYVPEEVTPDHISILKYVLLARILGVTFAIKLMERNEIDTQAQYDLHVPHLPEVKEIVADEKKHEMELIQLIQEERLNYIGSIVLGINDALVELTGALAGFTLAFANNKTIGLIGLITGSAAALSMASSEYLSTKNEEHDKHPIQAAIYTGLAYIFVVIMLILPYLIFTSPLAALTAVIIIGIVIIGAFTFYVSVTKDTPFGKHFLEMTAISLFVAGCSFGIGFALKNLFGIDA
jgi:VIT1/CCC1 family predicted Fe2+/Mn2+ transporter